MKIITVTLNTAVDVTVEENEYMESGLKTATETAAGKGINVSRALSCAAIPSIAVAMVGREDIQMFENIGNEYIKPVLIPVAGSTRRNITLTHCSDGKEHHTREKGFSVTTEDLDKVTKILSDTVNECDFVAFSGSLPVGAPDDTYEDMIMLCKKQGAKVILDTSGKPLIKGIGAGPYLIKPNLEELFEITGNDLSNTDSIEKAVKDISGQHNISYILTTLSEDGAVLYCLENDRTLKIQATELTQEIVSSVGCGDCTVAGYLAGIVNGMDIKKTLSEAMRFANANLYTAVPGEINL
ncbi:MAG: 1-phosphofructokinase family hexose kinase [Lachnospiraceae bacterium]|nr:1-phosphofructokinase family hexose kinase [Lachnospiraceae bacterium]